MQGTNINDMNFKQLRNEVQLLRDELAIFKRNYEDMIYNLDSDNFSGSYTAAQEGMKAQVKVAADSIKSMVSKTDLETSLEKYSKIEQTADAIQSTVSAEANLKDAALLEDVENFYDLSDEDIKKLDKSKIYKTQQKNESGKIIGEKYYYFNSLSQQWELISGDSIYTVFQQTDEGFVLRGNTVIDGSTTITRNLVLQGNITWDTSNTPVQAEYSSDAVSWHPIQMADDKYIRMSFDGGNVWSNATQIVGDKGEKGDSGSGGEADVTAEAVFDALTNGGENQGLFSAFYGDEDSAGKTRLFINAEYIHGNLISANVAQVASSVSIGDVNSNSEKTIHFTGGAVISAYTDGHGNPPTGIRISGSSIEFSGVQTTLSGNGSPEIYVNDKLLATQNWVMDNVGTTTYVAVFGE